MREKTRAILIAVACFLYIMSAAMLLKGHNKMTKYKNSDYNPVNAYVGGDAYNYIINGNYATGFFVLSMGFMATGTILIGTAVVISSIPERRSENEDALSAIARDKRNGESDRHILNDGGWKCYKCGKVNPPYVTSCSCGVSKFNNTPSE